MTRKHFNALAKALQASRPIHGSRETPDAREWRAALTQWQTIVEDIADVCSQFNGQFDCDRFYIACGHEL